MAAFDENVDVGRDERRATDGTPYEGQVQQMDGQ